jgi:hypothetical protein
MAKQTNFFYWLINHRERLLHRSRLASWLQQQVDEYGAELIEVRDQKSIFAAQEYGRQRAKHRYLMYVHDDVSLIDPPDLTLRIVTAFRKFTDLGLLGPTGKVQKKRVPWWLNRGAYVGHYCRRGNDNELIYQYTTSAGSCLFRSVVGDPMEDKSTPRWNKFAPAGLVDGFYLIEDRERLNVAWDTETYGDQWHGYDMDRCFQAHALGLKVMVPPWLFLHDNGGHAGYKGTNPKKIYGNDQANRRVNSVGDMLWLKDLDRVNVKIRAKWGIA